MTRYEVLERIGAGRMAEIFRGKAIAAGGFEKPVAIKRILPHLSSDPRFVELLIAEAKILSVLRHRNVVQIFDVGVGDDGHHFLVMEFVDGLDLGGLQRHLEAHRQRLPIDLVLHLGAEVCEALDHAQHAAGPDGKSMRLVHRDVTPGNVLVSRAGEVKLTDFGLAKRPEDGTSAGGLRGRFGYVSPEQASGMPVDGRADVFAVGVIMWELALGRRLFSGLPDFDALRAVRESSIARVRELDPSLPDDLDTILAEALAKDPAARLPSAGELGKRLRGLRYSLDDSSGDPAAALARLVAGAERAPAAPPSSVEAPTATRPPRDRDRARGKAPAAGGFDGAEPTVLRIRTADGFADDVEGTSLSAARRVLDSFEEEQTRMSRLPSAAFDDLVTTGGHRYRDSGELPAQPSLAPLHLPRESGEITAAAPPLDLDEPPRERRDAPRPARPAPRPSAAPPPRPTAPPPVPSRPPPSSSPDLRAPAARAAAAPPPAPVEPRPPARAAAPPGPVPRAPTNVPAGSSAQLPHASGSSSQLPHASSSSPQLPHFPAPAPAPAPAAPSRTFARPATAAGPPRAPTAHPAAFGRPRARRWWPIAVAAVVIAGLSFLITRAALDPPALATGSAPDARVAPDALAAPLLATIDAAPPLDAAIDATADAAIDASIDPDGGAPSDASIDDAIGDDATGGDALTDAGVPDAAAMPDAAAPARVDPTPPRRKPPARKPTRKKKRRSR